MRAVAQRVKTTLDIPERHKTGVAIIVAGLLFLAGVQFGIHQGAVLYGCR